MATPKTEDTPSTPLDIEGYDLANSGRFMDSLVTLLNEASTCMLQVKKNAGISAECSSAVPMNDEEKRDQMQAIVSVLSQNCKRQITGDEIGQSKCPGPPKADCFTPTSLPRQTGRGQRPTMGQMDPSSYSRQNSSYPPSAQVRYMSEEYAGSSARSSRGRGCSSDCLQPSNSSLGQRHRR
ncbi:uncharacterized protein LOC109541905 isoform X2 [Dendroctonus ponderosae]|uniref:uncharacterized protein LOC109541905 isoform X2 n=1 Tax=Dendroctonus ponderosae TaxID=77166 RepID=UPI002035AB0E|nr:uncharacterized protein LOC109541905 isoform X2 [Dendroctonus ponderosae]KAH1008617.1 hypothetical protein HUJ05_009155 [Dendroctonus ponderosae]